MNRPAPIVEEANENGLEYDQAELQYDSVQVPSLGGSVAK